MLSKKVDGINKKRSFSFYRSRSDSRISAGGSRSSRTGTPPCVLSILAVTLALFVAGVNPAIESSQISELQGKFRKLGGTVAPIEDKFGSDYRFPGRSEVPFDVANVLSTLCDAHLVKWIEVGETDDWHLVSALSANQAGRNLLQRERDHTSLLARAERRRLSSTLRNFYDAQIDLGWLVFEATSDIHILDSMFRAAELSRARDFLGSVYRRMDLGGRPSEEHAFAQFEAFLGYQEALANIRNAQVTRDSVQENLSLLKRTVILRQGNLEGRSLARFDDPKTMDTGVATASSTNAWIGIGEVLIMYHVTKKYAYAFVLNKADPPRVIRLPGNTVTLRKDIKIFHSQLALGPKGRGVKLALEPKKDSWRDNGFNLYKMLIQPLEQYLRRANRLLIIPHDLIHLVPFAALPTSKSGNNTFLVDHYTTVVLPTPMYRGWSSMRRREPTKLALVVGINEFTMANRLNFAEAEARAVAGTLRDSDLLLGSRGQATYRNVMNKMVRYEIVHIASHGSYIPVAPGASHVLLRGQGRKDDEPLMAVDLIGTRLNASLIVLSACQTATSHESGLPSDGDILGLPRSFLIAGAERVIASLWAVNDKSTQEFFEHLYRMTYGASSWNDRNAILSRVEFDVALARAQRQIRSKYTHPHYWAPFILIGVP